MIEIRGMQSNELKAVHSMLDRVFPSTPKSFFDQQVQHDPVLRPEDTRILLEDGTIRSCVRVYLRTIYCEGEKLKMGGIGDVGTDPKAQGKGYATRLMNDAVEYTKRRGAVLSFLFTRIHPFYERLGYFALPTLEIHVQPPSPPKTTPHRRTDIDRDLRSLKRMYENYNDHRVGPVVRDERYWRKQLKFPRLDPDLFWTGEENKEIVCYARGGITEDILKILEFGYMPGKEGLLRHLIAAMAHEVERKEVHLLYLSQKEVDLFSTWSPEIKENTALMVRLLQLDRLASFRKVFQPSRFLFWESDRF